MYIFFLSQVPGLSRITTETTFDGLTEDIFEAVKTDLINSIANALDVSSSSVDLKVKSSSRKRSEGLIVEATITTTESNELDAISSSINSGDFVSAVNNEIESSSALKEAGLTVTGASEAVVVTNG